MSATVGKRPGPVSACFAVLIISSLMFLSAIDMRIVPIHNSTIQPSTSGIHRTYWLKGDIFFNWNGSRNSPGPLITASDGDTVTIMLLANDSIMHDWYLDFNNNYAVDSNEIATMSPDFSSHTTWTNFTFTASLNQNIPHGGTFAYRCKFHQFSMFGNFQFDAGPVSTFTYSPSTPLVGHPVSFDASTSWPSTGANILTYKWDFADGNITSTLIPTITHRYSSAGDYAAKLNITDSASQNAASARTITIKTAPPIPFDYTITLTPNQATIIQGQNTIVAIRLNLVSGTPENVSLSTTTSPSDSTIQVSLDKTSGFPSFSATMTVSSALSSPIRTYTITIVAVSSTGVAHNATYTLTIKVNPQNASQPPNYALFAAIGTGVIASLLLAFIFVRRSKTKKQ